MQNFRSYWCHGLIGGLALFALGSAQISPAQEFTHDANVPHAQAAPRATNGTIGPPAPSPNGLPNVVAPSPGWSGFQVLYQPA
jgi:hypothetical protein